MDRRARPLALLVASALAAGGGAGACGGARRGEGAGSVARVASSATPAAAVAPPAAARPTVDVGDLTVRARSVLVTYAPEPDVPGVLLPLVSREEQRLWGLHEAARRRAGLSSTSAAARSGPDAVPLCGDGGVRPVPAQTAFAPAVGTHVEARAADGDAARAQARGAAQAAAARVELVRALDRARAARPATEATLASRVLRAYVEEVYDGTPEPRADDASSERSPGIERAASLYREAKEAAGLDTPAGFLARFRLAALESPADGAAEYDAILGLPLSLPRNREWARALAARPLGDWSRAAGVLRAVTLTAVTPAEKTRTRTEWLVATWNAGAFREAIDLAMVALREPSYPHVALDVAALAVARLGDTRVAAGLPPASYATLMHHVASMALDDRDLVLASEASRAVLVRAPESAEAPASSAVLAACLVLRGDRPGAEALLATAHQAYVPSGRWGERLRAGRVGADGYPSDAQIDALAGTLDAALPSSPEGEGAVEEERRAEIEIRANALARRCFAGVPLAARTGAREARVSLAVDTYQGRGPVASARVLDESGADGAEAAPAIAAALAPGLACVAQMAPRMFEGAPGGARATLRIVAATTAAP